MIGASLVIGSWWDGTAQLMLPVLIYSSEETVSCFNSSVVCSDSDPEMHNKVRVRFYASVY